jgi:hypothetical protein
MPLPVPNRQVKRRQRKKGPLKQKNKTKNPRISNLISSHLKIPSAWIDAIRSAIWQKGDGWVLLFFFPLSTITSQIPRCRCAARTRPPTQSGRALPFRPLVGPIRESRSWGGGPRSPGRGLVGRLVCGCVGWDGDDWLKWEGCPICFPRSRSCQTSVVFAPFLS